MSPRRPTIADVAREAGVSPSTASVVFSGKAPVSEATRERVAQAAARLGYAGPDPRAASLRTGRSGIVGVLVAGRLGSAFVDPATRSMMDGLAEAIAPLGAGLLLLRDQAPDDAAPTLTTAPIDAAVLVGCSPHARASLDPVRARGIPTVVIEGDAGPDVPRITLDNREAQRAIAEHVRSLGHRRVAAVTLPHDASRRRGILPQDVEITVDVTRDRLDGVRDVFPDAVAVTTLASSIDEGLEAGRLLLADPASRPTAVLAQSDMLAAGVIRAAEEAGLRVPADLSVTGFDGVRADGLSPYVLTTQVQDAAAKGRAAGEAVAALLRDGTAASVHLTCAFRLGNTTAPPPGKALGDEHSASL